MKDTSAKIIHFPLIDSTNLYAMQLLKETSDIKELNKTVIWADEQTAGRGRMNRPFYSPNKTGIYLTIIYVPEKPVEDAAIFTATAAVGIKRALNNIFKVDAKIKWVNDLYLNDRKIAGILTEGFFDYKKGCVSALVVGAGINISTSDFPEEIKNKAGAICDSVTEEIRESLVNEVIFQIISIYDSDQSQINKVCDEYRKASYLAGMEVEVCPVINRNEGNYKALVTGITDDFKLEIKKRDGSILQLDSGEVSILPQK